MRNTLLTTLAILLLITFNSCKRKEGCTNQYATNYDSEVKEKNDDGTCMYEVELNVWWDQSIFDSTMLNYTVMELYFDDCLVMYYLGIPNDIYHNEVPECGYVSSKKIIEFVGISEQKEIDIELLFYTTYGDRTPDARIKNTVNISAETDCFMYQITLD